MLESRHLQKSRGEFVHQGHVIAAKLNSEMQRCCCPFFLAALTLPPLGEYSSTCYLLYFKELQCKAIIPRPMLDISGKSSDDLFPFANSVEHYRSCSTASHYRGPGVPPQKWVL